MNTIKKTIITLCISGLLAAGSSMAYAEESADKSIADTIAHLEKGLEEAAKSDFSAATLHLKAARNSSGEIKGHELAVHKGVDDINNGMKEVKLGHPEKATDEIKKAIEVFKAL
jgi:hypothetical protein